MIYITFTSRLHHVFKRFSSCFLSRFLTLRRDVALEAEAKSIRGYGQFRVYMKILPLQK